MPLLSEAATTEINLHRVQYTHMQTPLSQAEQVRPLTSSGLWLDCAGLVTGLTGGQISNEAFLKFVWLSSIKDDWFSIIMQRYTLWSAKQQLFKLSVETTNEQLSLKTKSKL